MHQGLPNPAQLLRAPVKVPALPACRMAVHVSTHTQPLMIKARVGLACAAIAQHMRHKSTHALSNGAHLHRTGQCSSSRVTFSQVDVLTKDMPLGERQTLKKFYLWKLMYLSPRQHPKLPQCPSACKWITARQLQA